MLGAARRAAVSHKQELAASTQKDSDSGPAVEREDLLLAFERINAMSDDNIISLPELQAGADDPVIQSLLQGADLTIDELFTRADTDSNGEVSHCNLCKFNGYGPVENDNDSGGEEGGRMCRLFVTSFLRQG